MKSILTLILSLYLGIAYGEQFDYPILKKESRNIMEFIPEGWSLLDSASGDLNKDTFKDYVLIFQYNDSVSIEDVLITQPRFLGIFFWDNNLKTYTLIDQNNSFILNHDAPNMDDPFDEILIEKNVLLIKFKFWYSSGSWWTSTAVYKFRFDKNDFALIGFDSWEMHRATMETKSYSINFLSKKYTVSTEKPLNDDPSNEEFERTEEWKTFKLEKLKTLKNLERPFRWHFENLISI